MLRSNAKFVPGTSQNRQRISRHFDKTWRDAANDFGGSNPGELTAWVRFPAARVKDAHVYSGPGAHHRISLPDPTAIEISPVTRPHRQALNLNPNRNLARLRFLEIRNKITIKSGRKPFRLNSTAVPLPTPSSWGEGNISGALIVAISRSARVNSPVLTAVWKLCMVHCRNHVPRIRPAGMRSLAPNL